MLGSKLCTRERKGRPMPHRRGGGALAIDLDTPRGLLASCVDKPQLLLPIDCTALEPASGECQPNNSCPPEPGAGMLGALQSLLL